MNEYERAAAWRASHGLSRQALAEAIGYSSIAIYWFERGETPPSRNMKSGSESREIKSWVWRRYKMACAGLTAELKRKKEFDW